MRSPNEKGPIEEAVYDIWRKYGTGLDASKPPNEIEEQQREQLRAIILRSVTEALQFYVAKVNSRAEKEMERTHHLEGAHYRALIHELGLVRTMSEYWKDAGPVICAQRRINTEKLEHESEGSDKRITDNCRALAKFFCCDVRYDGDEEYELKNLLGQTAVLSAIDSPEGAFFVVEIDGGIE